MAPSEERYALALESLNYGVYDWDIEADTVYYAPTLRIMLGLSEADLAKPADWIARMHPDDAPLYRRSLAEHLKGLSPRFVCDTRYRSGDGPWRWARQTGGRAAPSRRPGLPPRRSDRRRHRDQEPPAGGRRRTDRGGA